MHFCFCHSSWLNCFFSFNNTVFSSIVSLISFHASRRAGGVWTLSRHNLRQNVRKLRYRSKSSSWWSKRTTFIKWASANWSKSQLQLLSVNYRKKYLFIFYFKNRNRTYSAFFHVIFNKKDIYIYKFQHLIDDTHKYVCIENQYRNMWKKDKNYNNNRNCTAFDLYDRYSSQMHYMEIIIIIIDNTIYQKPIITLNLGASWLSLPRSIFLSLSLNHFSFIRIDKHAMCFTRKKIQCSFHDIFPLLKDKSDSMQCCTVHTTSNNNIYESFSLFGCQIHTIFTRQTHQTVFQETWKVDAFFRSLF